ncbi:MAG: extracellular solute-binding protein, partial [Chloroflexi bacterium]|nr:extracellular solute-binding protein [Chloroflexota bacterium]
MHLARPSAWFLAVALLLSVACQSAPPAATTSPAAAAATKPAAAPTTASGASPSPALSPAAKPAASPAVSASPSVVPSPSPAASPAAAIPATVAKPSSGTLTIAVVQGSEGAPLKAIAPRYQQQYGVQVNIVESPYDQLYEKLVTTFQANTPAYDLVMLDDPWMPK